MDEYQHDRKELAFFGRVMASISHEFNNVISIVAQVGGLMEDLAAMQAQGREIPPEKWKLQTERIVAQAERGKAIVKNMNRFAHSIDEPVKTFDVGEVVANIAQIAHRLVTNRNSSLVLAACEPSRPITNDPFLLRYVILNSLDVLLACTPPPEEIRIACEQDEAATRIRLTGSGFPQNWEHHPALLDARRTADGMRARLDARIGSENAGCEIVLELAHAMNAGPGKETSHVE